MTPALHPAKELWFDFAAAQVDFANRTLLEAHLTYCESCRILAAEAAAAGALILRESAPLEAPSGLLAGILARLKAPEQPRVGSEALALPPALWPLLPDLSAASWRGAFTPGFRFLQMLQPGGPSLFLVHMEAGRAFPRHGHRGLERSLVLAGGLRTGEGVMEAGDFKEAASGHIHAPVALPDEDCWLLATLEDGIVLQGWRGLLQRIAGQ